MKKKKITKGIDIWNSAKYRGVIYQLLMFGGLIWLISRLVSNTIDNMASRGMKSGFGFLGESSGFSISQSLIDYSPESSYFQVFLVGLANTIVLAVVGIIFATIIGFIIGVMRMSHNWLISKIATFYVELVRNIPLLLWIFFSYYATLLPLPSARDLYKADQEVWFGATNGGLHLPRFEGQSGMTVIYALLILGVLVSFGYRFYAKKVQVNTGKRLKVWPIVLGSIVIIPILAVIILGFPFQFYPASMGRFRLSGAVTVLPEFIAMTIALSLYTASYIAEVVRAGLQAVARGQTEASYSLGLSKGLAVRLITIPQAMRVIIPPLTNQYLNLTKNSSLAATIAYPELVSVFAGTALNQSGRVFEILAMTMLTYLMLSLLTSGTMNWYNAKMKLIDR